MWRERGRERERERERTDGSIFTQATVRICMERPSARVVAAVCAPGPLGVYVCVVREAP